MPFEKCRGGERVSEERGGESEKTSGGVAAAKYDATGPGRREGYCSVSQE